MALNTEIKLNFKCIYSTTKDIGQFPTTDFDLEQRIKYLTGTGAGKADRLFYDERTINASSNEDLDIVGSLTDDFGATFSPARIKAILVKAAAANTNDVLVGAAAATQWAALLGTTGTVRVRPGAFFCAVAGEADATGYVCAAGATDLLRVANSGAGTSVTYQIVLIGVSA